MSAVTCGSWQKFTDGAGAVGVEAGIAVESPVAGVVPGVTAVGGTTVNGDVVSVTIMGNVSVTKTRGVGVDGACAGEAHAARTMVRSAKIIKREHRIFVFMVLSSRSLYT
jgi:hypothetical protein